MAPGVWVRISLTAMDFKEYKGLKLGAALGYLRRGNLDIYRLWKEVKYPDSG